MAFQAIVFQFADPERSIPLFMQILHECDDDAIVLAVESMAFVHSNMKPIHLGIASKEVLVGVMGRTESALYRQVVKSFIDETCG